MRVEFAYAQGRIQARNGDRLSPGAWQSLAASRTLAHYLHAVRVTSLRSWVQQLGDQAEPHEIERSLRADWRRQIDHVSTWLPVRWRAAMRFVTGLPELSVMTHLANNGEVAEWMLEDDRVRQLASTSGADREEGAGAALATALTRGDHPLEGWREAWETRWPERPEETAGLIVLIRRTGEFAGITSSASLPGETMSARRERLERHMLGIIRRWRLTPAAAFAYAVLLALDLQRLRGGLLRRACFEVRE